MKKIVKKCKWKIRELVSELFFRNKVVSEMKKEIENTEITIISCNCIGGRIYHDLGLRFLSPTINLYFTGEDFIKFCENIKFYLSIEVEEINLDLGYPCAKLGDIVMRLVHYKTFADFKVAWKRRVQRINYDNLYLIYIDRDGFEEPYLQRYAEIEYKKIFFSHKEYKDLNFIVYMPEFYKNHEVDEMTRYSNKLGYRNYEKYFDFVKWFNGNSFEKCLRNYEKM